MGGQNVTNVVKTMSFQIMMINAIILKFIWIVK